MASETLQTGVTESSDGPWWGHPLGEYRWQREAAGLMRDTVWRGLGPGTGDGSPVLLVPGFLSGDPSFACMRRWLRRIGFRSYRAGIAWNVGCANVAVKHLDERVDSIAQRAGSPVHIVAHSRGGLFARALLSRHPDHIAQVITLGSPLAAEFDTSVSVSAAVVGARLAQYAIHPDARPDGCFTSQCKCGYSSELAGKRPEPVKLTSIYTTDDGIVRPSSCQVPAAECIAVRGSHLGLVVNAEVYRHIARIWLAAADESHV